MTDSLRAKLERALKDADAAANEDDINRIVILHDAVTEALAQLDEMERDHEAIRGLLRKSLGWEGRMNAAEQSLMQGHKRDALDQQNSVIRERNEVKLILGKKGETNG